MSSLAMLGKTKNIPLARSQVQYIKFTDAKFGEHNIERHMSEAQKELFLPQFRYLKSEARSIYNQDKAHETLTLNKETRRLDQSMRKMPLRSQSTIDQVANNEFSQYRFVPRQYRIEYTEEDFKKREAQKRKNQLDSIVSNDLQRKTLIFPLSSPESTGW